MQFLTYWELNENMSSADRLKTADNLMSKGLFPPKGVNIVRWDATPDLWGTLILEADSVEDVFRALAGIPQIKPTFLEIAPSGIPSNIIPHSKGVKCGLIRSNSPFSYSNHRPAKPKIPKPLVYAQVSPLGTSFATP